MRKFILLSFIIGVLFVFLIALDNEQSDFVHIHLFSLDTLVDNVS